VSRPGSVALARPARICARIQTEITALTETGAEIGNEESGRRAAERFFQRLSRGQGAEPLRIITDKLRSYSAETRNIFPDVTHIVERYTNNRAEASHQSTRQRERQMRRFKSARHA
jgi:hypothetical protein